MRYISISNMRKNIGSILKDSIERICLTKRGTPIAVIINIDDYRATEEMLVKNLYHINNLKNTIHKLQK